MKANINTNETNEVVEVTEKKAKKRRSLKEFGHDTWEKLKTRDGRIEILKDCGKVAIGVGIGVIGAIGTMIAITSGYETDPGPDDDYTDVPDDESNPIAETTDNEETVEVDNGNSDNTEESSDDDASDEETI